MSPAMRAEIDAMLGDIISCPLDSRAASLFVILDNIRYVKEEDTDTFDVEELSMLYEIEPAEGQGPNKFGECIFLGHTTGGINGPDVRSHILQKTESLTRIMRMIPVEPNEEVFLITWDHGSAFGVFRDGAVKIANASLRTPIDNDLDAFPYLKLFWDRALEEEAVQRLLHRKSTQQPVLTVQIGHAVYVAGSEHQLPAGLLQVIGKGDLSDFFDIREGGDKRVFLVPNSEKFASLAAEFPGYKPAPIGLSSAQVPEILKNDELRDVIHNWLIDKPTKKVSVLLMMNCWMMNLHTLYTLRDEVRFLVAPQGFIDSPGYNYLYILRSVYTAPVHIAAQQLAINCVEFSHDSFLFARARRINPTNPDSIKTRVIVTVRLDYPEARSAFDDLIDATASIVDELHRTLMNETDLALTHLMQYMREIALEFTRNEAFMVDLPNYLASLQYAFGGLTSTALLGGIRGRMIALEDMAQKALPVIEPRYIGPLWNTANQDDAPWRLTGKTPTGYSIFFPNTGFSDPNLIDNIKKDELLLNSSFKWKQVINKLYDKIIP